jgi:endo-1,4-beta-xylanase
MPSRNLLPILFTVIVFVLYACSTSKKGATSSNATTLKEAYKNDFLIGAALNGQQIEEKDAKAAALIPQQFSVLTPENIMKCEIIHPQWDKYNFDLADKLIAYGQKNNIPVVGHTLIWHSQLSPFVRNLKSADSLKQFFADHITTIAARYDGKIKGWDVVNEALEEDGSMRNTIFLNLLGEDYVTEAFRLAQKAAPNTELYYNDYNIEQPKKRAGTVSLIKKIQAAGVRIDGVGIQGHWHTGRVPFQEIEESIKEFSAMGLKVMFTEVDLEVLPRNFQGADVNQRTAENPALNPYKDGLPDSVLQQQTWDYENLFRLFLKYKNQVDRVTFWGVNDGQSWLNNWPVRGRTNYPLLFDRQFNPKPSYYKLLELKKTDSIKKQDNKKPA